MQSPRLVFLAVAVLGVLSCTAAVADPAVGVTAGTTGLGGDVNIPILPILGLRVGYSGFVYHHDINQTDVDYAGRLHTGAKQSGGGAGSTGERCHGCEVVSRVEPRCFIPFLTPR